MTHHDELTALRRYTRKQAAHLLAIPDTWLECWVTDRQVPHQRCGKPGPRQCGVWFTYDDILAIGRMLLDLQSVRQANSRAESSWVADPTEPARDKGAEAAAEAVASHTSDAELAQFRDLASHWRVSSVRVTTSRVTADWTSLAVDHRDAGEEQLVCPVARPVKHVASIQTASLRRASTRPRRQATQGLPGQQDAAVLSSASRICEGPIMGCPPRAGRRPTQD